NTAAICNLELSSPSAVLYIDPLSHSVNQFLALVRKLDVNLDTISTRVDSVLTRLKKKFDVTLALYQRFENISFSREKETMRSCWTMFLLAKGRALQMEDDLVISFQLLLCVLEFFIKRCPADLLQPLYQSAINRGQSPPTRTSRRNQSKAKPRPPEPEVDMQLLETLCKENDCNAEEVCSLQETLTFYFSLQANDLNQQYEEHYLKSRDFDGRLFLDGDETLLDHKLEMSQVERTPKKNVREEEPVLIAPQTPVRAAMSSIQQLRVDLTSSGDQPSANLVTYFKNCTVDPTEEVLKRVETLGQVFGQRFGQAVGPRCVALGKQVQTNFQNKQTVVHPRCPAVLQSHGVDAKIDLCFPWILDVFNLAAFDFYKVIESFIKAEPTLSKEIVKHLESCEHLIMENIAWRMGSPLFELLKQTQEAPAEQVETPAAFTQPLQHNHTAADLYLSPMRPGHRVLPPESAATPGPQPVAQAPSQPTGQTPRPPRSNSLNLFYKKLYRLAYMRLKMLCSYLLPSHPDLEHIMWTLFQHTLQHEYELMRDRHLDQLMMSAMYAICKVKNVDLRFKTIVTSYKNMPNTNQETFKHVLITEGHYDSIIVFYNQVFIQKLKTIILQYASPRPPTLSPIPQIPCSPYKFPSSPLRVPGSNNVYISPMKNPRLSPGIMTPRSRMLVSIGESFGLSSRFQKINQMVNSSNLNVKRSLDLDSTPKPLKRLRFDVDGQDEADGRLVTKGLIMQHDLILFCSARSRIQEQNMKEDAESRKE
uniref:Retinoblastoma 1 n=1 Tax=Myripristis murdjan TaxID=586833 RepID=A0A668AWB4_9TELE